MLLVRAPHRPVAVVSLVGEELRVRCFAEIGDPQIGGVAAAIVLARPDGGMPVEDELLAVGRVAAPVAPIDRQRLLRAAADRDFVQRRDVRERAVAVRRTEHDVLRVARPADDLVVAGVDTSAAAARRRPPARRTRRCCRSDSTRTRSSARRARTADTSRAPRLSVSRNTFVPSSFAVQMSPR